MIKRVLGWSFLLAVIGGVGFLVYDWTRAVEIPELEVPGKWAPVYVEVSREKGVPWYVLAAADETDSRYEGISRRSIEKRAERLIRAAGADRPGEGEWEEALRRLFPGKRGEKAVSLAEAYRWAASPLDEDYVFPFRAKDRNKVSYGDTWGAGRTYGGKRKHEGTDLMAPKGTPIRSVGNGRVIFKGWNELGGWRMTILDTDHPHISFYYAHMQRYAKGLETGDEVKKGQVIGYVGDSGYGPEGTTGKFAPHLHLGIYVRESLFSPMREPVNPYPFLRVWDAFAGR